MGILRPASPFVLEHTNCIGSLVIAGRGLEATYKEAATGAGTREYSLEQCIGPPLQASNLPRTFYGLLVSPARSQAPQRHLNQSLSWNAHGSVVTPGRPQITSSSRP